MMTDQELDEVVAAFADLHRASRKGGALRVKASELHIVAGKVVQLVGYVVELRAANRELGKACENLIQELQRCAADGGGYSCAVVDEAREAIEGGPT